jgi:Spy/CpxP family protein refolding chaperone
MSKLYKILTPEQQQKLMAFHQAMKSTKKVPN